MSEENTNENQKGDYFAGLESSELVSMAEALEIAARSKREEIIQAREISENHVARLSRDYFEGRDEQQQHALAQIWEAEVQRLGVGAQLTDEQAEAMEESLARASDMFDPHGGLLPNEAYSERDRLAISKGRIPNAIDPVSASQLTHEYHTRMRELSAELTAEKKASGYWDQLAAHRASVRIKSLANEFKRRGLKNAKQSDFDQYGY